eukprot:gene20853-32159_t
MTVPTQTGTFTDTGTSTSSLSRTASLSATASQSMTVPTQTVTFTDTETGTLSLSQSLTSTATVTQTGTLTVTGTDTLSLSQSQTPTTTETASLTESQTPTTTETVSLTMPTQTETATQSLTVPTATETSSHTVSETVPTATETFTASLSSSETVTRSRSLTMPTATETDTFTLPTPTMTLTADTPLHEYTLIHQGVRCSSGSEYLGHTTELETCAALCARRTNCRLFSYGFATPLYPTAVNRCYWQPINTDTCVAGYVPDGYNTFELHREASACTDASLWGQVPLPLLDAEIWPASSTPQCGEAAHCVDGVRKISDSGTDCTAYCISGYASPPSLVVRIRQPTTLTSVRIYVPGSDEAHGSAVRDGYQVYISGEVESVGRAADEWVLCHNVSTVFDTDYGYYSAPCVGEGVRSVKVEYGASALSPLRFIALAEVELYGCVMNFTRPLSWINEPPSSPSSASRVDRASHVATFCGLRPDLQWCQVPIGTSCYGGLVTDWSSSSHVPTMRLCGGHGVCMPISDVSSTLTTTCLCESGFTLRFVGRHHVTCVVENVYPGYNPAVFDETRQAFILSVDAG